MDALRPKPQPSLPARKRNPACSRCRRQKIRCGNQWPSCSRCVKAGIECVRTGSAGNEEASRQYIRQLEQRVEWLEDVVRRVSPDTLSQQQQFGDKEVLPSFPDIHSMLDQSVAAVQSDQPSTDLAEENTQSPRLYEADTPCVDAPRSPSTASRTSNIGLSQPLAHDVGLLSLANSTEPKYLGPSSGTSFARIIFAAVPQSQGLSISKNSTAMDNTLSMSSTDMGAEFLDLPKEEELSYFVGAYFDAWHPMYPFIHEQLFQDTVSRIYGSQLKEMSLAQSIDPSLSIDTAQLFLVVALGAKYLESKLSTNFESRSYYTTALHYIGKCQLHDSIRGVQILLLLVLTSFTFVDGMNAWFLTSTILASCVDLGLHRKYIESRGTSTQLNQSLEVTRAKELRCRVFWTAYSLDRTLCVILGRPLTLRDEAIDVEYPGEWETQEIDHNAVYRHYNCLTQQRNQCSHQSPYMAAIHSFRFDRVTAEIKLMLYRVAQSPTRFPWPTELSSWQQQSDSTCRELLQDAQRVLKWGKLSAGGSSGLRDNSLRLVELKYHHCLMLLNRPSPAIPHPTSSALMTCYESAIATIQIYSELARFANLTNSWLTAHAVFVCGITTLYCIWTSPEVRKSKSIDTFLQQAELCTNLLSSLGKTWSVARNAQTKFELLVQQTKDSWEKSGSNNQSHQTQGSIVDDATQMSQVYTYENLDIPPSDSWDNANMEQSITSNTLIDELGEMSAWFDLDWLGDTNFSP